MPHGDWVDVSGTDGFDAQGFVHDIIYQQTNDEYAQHWFNESFLNGDLSDTERENTYKELVDYLWDEYGIDFEEVFDWQDFREWYG